MRVMTVWSHGVGHDFYTTLGSLCFLCYQSNSVEFQCVVLGSTSKKMKQLTPDLGPSKIFFRLRHLPYPLFFSYSWNFLKLLPTILAHSQIVYIDKPGKKIGTV